MSLIRDDTNDGIKFESDDFYLSISEDALDALISLLREVLEWASDNPWLVIAGLGAFCIWAWAKYNGRRARKKQEGRFYNRLELPGE